MPSETLTRFLLAIGIIVLGWLLYRLITRSVLQREHPRSGKNLFQPGLPAILYFTTPDCAACISVQKPALARIQNNLGNQLQIVEINAYEQPDLAKEWGVMSVPTTFLIDASGAARQVNYGVTPAEKLMEQIKRLDNYIKHP